MMQPHIAETAIKRVIAEFSSDSHNIFTPFALCNEVLDKIPSLNGNILVVANLEFVYNIVLRGVDASHVFFATPCPKKKKMATAWIPESNIFMYNNVITKEDVGDMKFDVVVGNPPYQNPDAINPRQRTIWPKFVEMAFQLNSNQGYVAFVTPKTWTVNSMYESLFTSRKPIYLNVDECSRYFPGVGSSFSYYVVQNTPDDGSPFSIQTSTGSVISNGWPEGNANVTSVVGFNTLQKLLNGDHYQVFTSSGYNTSQFSQKSSAISKTRSDEHPHPVLHKTLKTEGDVFFYARDVDSRLAGIPRVILELWVANYDNIRVSDSLLTCQQYRHIQTDTLEEAECLRRVLLSKPYKFIASSLTTGGSFTTKSFSFFPKIDLTRSWTDEELYAHFNLTEEEINLIEETIK